MSPACSSLYAAMTLRSEAIRPTLRTTLAANRRALIHRRASGAISVATR